MSTIPRIATILKQLDAAQSGARTRLLSKPDIQSARNVFVAFRKYCEKHGLLRPSLYMDCGALPNAYKYAAESTQLVISQDDQGRVVAEVYRRWARKVRHGDSGALRLAAVKSDDEDRTWPKMPAFRFSGKTRTFANSGYMYF